MYVEKVTENKGERCSTIKQHNKLREVTNIVAENVLLPGADQDKRQNSNHTDDSGSTMGNLAH